MATDDAGALPPDYILRGEGTGAGKSRPRPPATDDTHPENDLNLTADDIDWLMREGKLTALEDLEAEIRETDELLDRATHTDEDTRDDFGREFVAVIICLIVVGAVVGGLIALAVDALSR